MPMLPSEPHQRAEVTTTLFIAALLVAAALVYPSALSHVLLRSNFDPRTGYWIAAVPPALFALAVGLRARTARRAFLAVGCLLLVYLLDVQPLWDALHDNFATVPTWRNNLTWVVLATLPVAAWGIARRRGTFWTVGLLSAWPLSYLTGKAFHAVTNGSSFPGVWTAGAAGAVGMLATLAAIWLCYQAELQAPTAREEIPAPTPEPAGSEPH